MFTAVYVTITRKQFYDTIIMTSETIPLQFDRRRELDSSNATRITDETI